MDFSHTENQSKAGSLFIKKKIDITFFFLKN